MHQYNLLVRDSILESWARYNDNVIEKTATDTALLKNYDKLNTKNPLFVENPDSNFTWW